MIDFCEYKELYIGGRWAAPATDKVIKVRSPHTEQVVGQAPEASTEDVDGAVTVARKAFEKGKWPQLFPDERLEIVQRFARLYRGRLGPWSLGASSSGSTPTSRSASRRAPS